MKPEMFNSYHIGRARYPSISFPCILNIVGLYNEKFLQEIGHKLSYVAMLLRNNKRIAITGEQADINILIKEIIERIIKDKNFVKKKYIQFNQRKKELIDFTRKNLILEKIKKADNKELYNLLINYFQRYENFCGIAALFIFFLADPFEKEIKKRIKLHHEFLLKSPNFPYTTEYELDYFDRCDTIADELHKKWSWIPFDYIGPEEWGKEYFLKKMDVDFERLKKLKEDNITLRENQKKAFREYDPIILRLIKDFHILSYIQDERKGATTLTHVYLQKYLYNEISKRTCIKIEHLRIMIPDEIRDALLFNKKFDSDLLKKRMYESLILFYNNKFSVHQGDYIYKRFVELLPTKKEIKGTVVCKGKVKGVVKVCLTSNDISKVKKGDILVAPMTTPDYILAIGRAAGFITDEGGMTCHAAIVAREMNKPCIIGTGFATDLLKDGDLIELDAEEGIVRKIE